MALLKLFCLVAFFVVKANMHAHLLYNSNLNYELYHLCDLGITDIAPEKLTRASFPNSLGPRINQQGHITGNTIHGGFVFDRINPMKYLRRNGQLASVYDLNDRGLVLASVQYDSRNVEWLLWPYKCFCKKESISPIDLKCLPSRDVHFRSLNNKNVLVGSRFCFEEQGYMAVFYSPEKGIQGLTCAFLSEVNENGNMAGHEALVVERTPLIYHYRGGWNGLSDEPSLNKPSGCTLYQMDMAIAPDDTVFGSFLSHKRGMPYIYGYAWNPCERYFSVHDFNGMQISAVNNCHTLVGTLCGEAVISNNMEPPVALSSLIAGCRIPIRLIEATDINDMGEIVGYGMWEGSLHLFLLTPIRQ